MNPSDAIELKGAPGSPYTRKMMAVLRYRHIPFRLLIGMLEDLARYPRPKVELLPTFYLPDADGKVQAVTDSTPIIRRLEKERAGRSVIPTDPALRFIDELIEDYADEWLTKAMFHYRWHYAADIDKSGTILPLWRGISMPQENAVKMKQQFSERQIGRLKFVGSSPATAALIEASYLRFLDIFEAHLQQFPFLLGDRPSSCDFAAYGQLTQLAHFDPTPAALTLARAKRVYAWVFLVDDLSGAKGDAASWIAPGVPSSAPSGASDDSLPATLQALLAEIGRVYVPVMLANARALKSGAGEVQAQIDGQPWRQQPFPYQGKCVQWLRESFQALPAPQQALVRRWLAPAGCLPLLEAAI